MTTNCEVSGSVSYGDCYSSFHHPRDVIAKEGPFDTSSSSVYQNIRLPSLAINGFYCYSHEFNFCSNARNAHHPQWWMINLKRVVTVESVIVIMGRGHNYFRDVIVRLGNDETHTNNEMVFKSVGEPEHSKPHVMELPSVKSGQYLSLESNKISYLAIGLVQIIEKN